MLSPAHPALALKETERPNLFRACAPTARARRCHALHRARGAAHCWGRSLHACPTSLDPPVLPYTVLYHYSTPSPLGVLYSTPDARLHVRLALRAPLISNPHADTR